MTAHGGTPVVLDRAVPPHTPQGERWSLTCDLTDVAATTAAFARILDRHPRLDGPVCCAGGGTGAPDENSAAGLSPATLQEVLDGNLFSALHTVDAALPGLGRATSPAIVTIGSLNGRAPLPGVTTRPSIPGPSGRAPRHRPRRSVDVVHALGCRGEHPVNHLLLEHGEVGLLWWSGPRRGRAR